MPQDSNPQTVTQLLKQLSKQEELAIELARMDGKILTERSWNELFDREQDDYKRKAKTLLKYYSA